MKSLFYSLMVAMMLVSCEIQTSSNGDLDGFWQLRAVDTLATGGESDMRGSGIYWAVQKRLLEVQDKNGVYGGVFFRFSHAGDSLLLSDPYVNDRISADVKVEDADMLRPFGVNRLDEGFHIEMLDGGNMVLRSETLRLWFRKY